MCCVQPRVRETWLNSFSDDAASILKNLEPAQFLKCSRTGELFDGSCSSEETPLLGLHCSSAPRLRLPWCGSRTTCSTALA